MSGQTRVLEPIYSPNIIHLLPYPLIDPFTVPQSDVVLLCLDKLEFFNLSIHLISFSGYPIHSLIHLRFFQSDVVLLCLDKLEFLSLLAHAGSTGDANTDLEQQVKACFHGICVVFKSHLHPIYIMPVRYLHCTKIEFYVYV